MFDRIRLGALFIICLVVPFIGCGSSSQLDSLSVLPTTVNFGAVGLTAQLTATGTVGHGTHPSTTEDVTNLVHWSSASVDVATVSATGLVTSTGPGTVQITASINGFTGLLSSSSNVTVTITTTSPTSPTSTDVTAVSIVPASETVVSPGATGQFVAIGTTASGTTQNVTSSVLWGSTIAQVGTISQTGLVTAVGTGTTTITAIFTNPDKTVATGTGTFTVTGTGTGTGPTEPYTSVTVIPGTQTIPAPGATAQFIAIGKSGSTGLQEDITSLVAWKSSSITTATINPVTGLATGVGQGTTAITAIYTNPADQSVVTGSAALTITGTTGASPEPVASITIIPASLSVSGPGQSGQFIALGTAGGSGLQSNITSSVTWSSSTVGVATIGAATGLASSVAQGTTAITAIYTNPDNSVVSGAATFVVTGASSTQIASLAILPGSQTVTLPLAPPTIPTVSYLAIGTSGSGLQQNETSAVSWTSSDTAVATIGSGATSGQVTLVGQGTTTLTAQYTNLAAGSIPANVVTSTATLNVTGVASEPLLSIAILPPSQTVGYPLQQSQFTAIGTFSAGPTTQNLNTSTTYPASWSSSDPSVATVDAATGLVTAVGQGTTAITAIAANPDKSVVTNVASFTVTNGAAQQISALTIVPGTLALSATGQPGQFIALGTSGVSGTQQDVTNSPQLTWSSSVPTIATVGNLGTGVAGQVIGASVGNTNITAEWTNPASGSTPVTSVAATAPVTVTETAAAEPLLSINVIPTSITDLDLLGTGQYLAYGTFSTAPTEMEVTNGFSHPGFPVGCTANCPTVPVTWISTAPFIFPINSAGANGSTGGLVTADGTGTADIYATAVNPDGTLVNSSISTFNCPYAEPTYGTTTVTLPNGTTTTVPNYNEIINPGTCNSLTIDDSLLSTLTVFGTGLNTTNWLITAPSATGTPNVIHCGGSTEQGAAGGSVCEATYPNGTLVTLTAPAEAGVNFGGWSSTCNTTGAVTAAGPNTCQVVVGGGCTLNQQTETYICTSSSNVSVGAVFN